jgi:hypothetical protein
VRSAVLILLFASLVAYAADAAGTWRMAYSTENGLPREATLHLKVEGDRLAGTWSSDRGLALIENGEISGDDIRFDLIRKSNYDEIAVHFKGRIEGDRMKLTMQFGRRKPIEIAGKKAF